MTAPGTSNPVDPKVAQALRRQRTKEAAQKARLRKEDELRALQAQVAQLRREKRSLQIALDEQCAHSQNVMERVTILVARHKALAAANMALQSHLAHAQELFPELRDHLPPMASLEDPAYLQDGEPSPRAPSPRFLYHHHHHHHPHDVDLDLDRHHHHAPDPMAVDASDATESFSTAPTAITARPSGLIIFSATPRITTLAGGRPPAHPSHSHASHDDYHPHHSDSPSPDPSTTAPANAPTRSTSSAPPPPGATLRHSSAGASPFNPSGHRVTLGRPTCSDSQDSAGATTTLQRHWSGTAPYPPDVPPPRHPLCSLEGVASTSSYLTRPTPSPVQIAPSHSDGRAPQPEPTLSIPSRAPPSSHHRDSLPSTPAAPLHRRSHSPSHTTPASPPPPHHQYNHQEPPTVDHVIDPTPYNPSEPQPPPFPYAPPPTYSSGRRSRSYPEPTNGDRPLSQTSTEPSSYYHDDITQDTHGTHDDYPPLNDPPSFNLSTLLTLSSIPVSMPPHAAPQPLGPPSESTFSASTANPHAQPPADPSHTPPLSPSEVIHPPYHPHSTRHPQIIVRSHSEPVHNLRSVDPLADAPAMDTSEPYAMPSVPSLQMFATAPPAASTPSPWPHAYTDTNTNSHLHPDDDDQLHYADHDGVPYHPSPCGHHYPPPEYYPADGADEPYPPSHEDHEDHPEATHPQLRPNSRQQLLVQEWATEPPLHAPRQDQRNGTSSGSRLPAGRPPQRLNDQRTRLQQLVWTTDQ